MELFMWSLCYSLQKLYDDIEKGNSFWGQVCAMVRGNYYGVDLSCPNASRHCNLAWNIEIGLTHWNMQGSIWLQADAWRSFKIIVHVFSTAFNEREGIYVKHIKYPINNCLPIIIVMYYC